MFKTCTIASLVLAISAPVALAETNNCTPANAYKPGVATTTFDEVYAATLAGDAECVIPLYSPSDSGDLMVRLESYGLVGDSVHLYQVSSTIGGQDLFYQVYFPETEYWAWVPAVWVVLAL